MVGSHPFFVFFQRSSCINKVYFLLLKCQVYTTNSRIKAMKKKCLMIILTFILFALHFSAGSSEISFFEQRITGASFEAYQTPYNSTYQQFSGTPKDNIIPSEKFFLYVGNNIPVSHISFRKTSTVSFFFRNTGQVQFVIPATTENKNGIFQFLCGFRGSSPLQYYIYFLRRIII